MRPFLLILLLLSTTAALFAQDSGTVRKVNIVHADRLTVIDTDTAALRMLVGNVELLQDSTRMFCDSAVLDRDANRVKAYGNVHIAQRDSVHAWSDRLFYEGDAKLAELDGNCRLTDSTATVTSEKLYYDTRDDIGWYETGGTIVADSTVLTSRRGTYYPNTKDAFFRGDVVVIDSQFTLTGDTLRYNTETKTAFFFERTRIEHDSSTILCRDGWYNTDLGLAAFGRETSILDAPQRLDADSLYYDREAGRGEAWRRFVWTDTSMHLLIRGTHGVYLERSDRIDAFDHPLMVHDMDGDSLYLSAKVLRSEEDTGDVRWFTAFYGARMYKSDFQAVADSMSYSFRDSIFRLYQRPILWSDRSEMQGDTILVQMRDDAIHRTYFQRDASIISQSTGKLFDQVHSIDMTGHFRDGELRRLLAEGDAISLYFAENDDETGYVGANRAEATRMWIYMRDDEVARISFLDQPTAVFTPMRQMPDGMLYLEGFEWNHDLRPKDALDVMPSPAAP